MLSKQSPRRVGRARLLGRARARHADSEQHIGGLALLVFQSQRVRSAPQKVCAVTNTAALSAWGQPYLPATCTNFETRAKALRLRTSAAAAGDEVAGATSGAKSASSGVVQRRHDSEQSVGRSTATKAKRAGLSGLPRRPRAAAGMRALRAERAHAAPPPAAHPTQWQPTSPPPRR